MNCRVNSSSGSPGGAAAADGLVIHVGEVHHAMDLEAAGFEMPLEEVLEDVGAEVADVGVVIDRRAAGVHLHALAGGIERREVLDLARVGIEEADGTCADLTDSTPAVVSHAGDGECAAMPSPRPERSRASRWWWP